MLQELRNLNLKRAMKEKSTDNIQEERLKLESTICEAEETIPVFGNKTRSGFFFRKLMVLEEQRSVYYKQSSKFRRNEKG